MTSNDRGSSDYNKINRDRLDLDSPRWDQRHYVGRLKHFFTSANPFNIFYSDAALDSSKKLISAYKQGKEPPNTTVKELWKAKQIYDSAFHPETGEKMILIGRMSAQAPCNMAIIGSMLTFYKSTPAVIFWQWINQSFNAVVNYTNRSGKSPSYRELFFPYFFATTGAVTTAIGLNSVAHKAPPLVGRFIPFAAVAAANCINIPMMRQKELSEGILVKDKDGTSIGYSKNSYSTYLSYLLVLSPIVMNFLDKKPSIQRMPYVRAPIQILLTGILLTFMTPACCAIFPQERQVVFLLFSSYVSRSLPYAVMHSMLVSHLEPELRNQMNQRGDKSQYVYFNKGL
ncbi:Sideroflexin-1 [Trichoplax sp. H2]|nr:Sideroflexin-1 [Trichoplax sp. H2]|eukprot:RDD41978.1 Sideroflexin-1 [Trichoplax sp. H2]